MKTFTLTVGFTLLLAMMAFTQIIRIPQDYASIQEGIVAAADGVTVLVAPGIYYESINFAGKPITVASEFLLTGDTSYISQTQISGDSTAINSLVIFNHDETAASILCGFKLCDNATFSAAGITCYHASPTLMHLIFDNLDASYYGGAVACRSHSNPTIAWATITNCTATHNGGAIALEDTCSPLIHHLSINNCETFVENGGALYCKSNCNPVLSAVSISNCRAASSGSAMYLQESSPIIKNALITGCDFSNTIECIHHCYPEFRNTTITNNSGHFAGAIYSGGGCQPQLTNCILYANSPSELYFLESGELNGVSVTHTLLEGGQAGIYHGYNCKIYWHEGNLDADPAFSNGGALPYALTSASPAVDAGTPDTTGLLLSGADPAGNIRVWDGNNDGTAVVDMGPYEYGAGPSGTKQPDHVADVDRLAVYPNPAVDVVNVDFLLKQRQRVTIRLVDAHGAAEIISDTQQNAGMNHLIFPLPPEKSGWYILQVTSTTNSSAVPVFIR